MPVELNPRNAWDMVLQTHLDGEGALNWRVVSLQYVGPQERKYVVEVDSWTQSSSFADAPAGVWRFIVWSDCRTRSCVTLDLGMAYQQTFYSMA